MWYVGVDVHRKTSTYVVVDQGGNTVQTRTVSGSVRTLLAALAEIKRPFEVVFEASTGYGHLYDRLTTLARRVVVAHPGQLRLIARAKHKNDRFDAKKLAQLLLLDLVPTAHVPPSAVRAWRGMIEYRMSLVDERTRAKNALRALPRTHDVETPKSLWTKKGLAWVRTVEFPEPLDALRRSQLVHRIETLNGDIRAVEKELDRIARDSAGVRRLRTIPGVGIRTAEALVAYVDAPARFHRNKAVGKYFGLVPCQDASGGRNRLGHITKDGPATVRRLLTQAAWQAVRRSAVIRRRFERIAQGDTKRRKIALVAIMHYLVRVAHALLRDGEVWRLSAA
jgi:transposase